MGALWIERQLILPTPDLKSGSSTVMAGLFSHALCPCSSLYPRVVKQCRLRVVTCALALAPAAQYFPFLGFQARSLKHQGRDRSFRWYVLKEPLGEVLDLAPVAGS